MGAAEALPKLREGMEEAADNIATAAQLAASLEACSYPKPGNVHRMRDFRDTKLEHFIAGGIAIGPYARRAAVAGMEASLGLRRYGEVGLGKLIREGVANVRLWHRGGNTSLGVATLLIPLAAAFGECYASEGAFREGGVIEGFRRIAEASTPEDAANFYEAVRFVMPGGLGRPRSGEAPDALRPCAAEEALKMGLTLDALMKVCAKWDGVCREWSERYSVTFGIGAPTIIKVYRATGDLNAAVIQAFLTILSLKPDTLIARKAGEGEAERVSRRASEVLDAGGALTDEGRRELIRFDRELDTPDNRLNPGTTADLTASSLMAALLFGVRP